MTYKVAIPSYKRPVEIVTKTLSTLKEGGVPKNSIHIFVANKEEEKAYSNIPSYLFHKIVVGKKGIAKQRIFIKRYFKEGDHVVSIDDDVTSILKLNTQNKLEKMKNVHIFFKSAFDTLRKKKLFIWGVYPVNSALFMRHTTTTDLRFILGTLHGYIVRHDKYLDPSSQADGKEDYEQSILYYKKDGGVVRFNNVAVRTQFFAKGGLGELHGRYEQSRKAAEYLKRRYPNIVTIHHRKGGHKEGLTEIRLRRHV